jgi:hypothetical protein
MAKGISALADRLDRNHKLLDELWQDEPKWENFQMR